MQDSKAERWQQRILEGRFQSLKKQDTKWEMKFPVDKQKVILMEQNWS